MSHVSSLLSIEAYMNFNVESLFLRVIKVNYPVFLILLGILLLLFNPSADAAKMVRVGVYDNKPLVFIDDDGKPQGIFIDLLEHVASKEHWDLKYTPGTWSECLERLESGEIDLMTAIAYSKERGKKYNFTYETVITNWGQVFVQKNCKDPHPEGVALKNPPIGGTMPCPPIGGGPWELRRRYVP